MDDQLDNDLKNRIREVFDNYEDTTADEGWLLLREKYPAEEKKRPAVWLWWAGVAAGLLLFLSIGVWMLGKKMQPDNTLALKPAKHQQQQKIEVKDSAAQLAATQTAPATVPVDTVASAPNNIDQNKLSAHKNQAGSIASIQNNIALNNQPAPKSHVGTTSSTPNNTAQNKQQAPKNPAINNTNTAAVQPNNIAAGNQQKHIASNNTAVNQTVVIGGNNGINNNVAVVVHPNNIAAGNQQKHIASNNTAVNQTVVIGGNNGINNNVAVVVHPNSIAAGNQQKLSVPNNTAVNKPVVIGGNKGIDNNVAVVQSPANKQPGVIAPPAKGIDSVKGISPKTDATQYAANNAIVPNKTGDVKPNNADKQATKAAKPVSAINAMFAAEQNQPKHPEEKQVDDKRVKFGVYAATFFNYAKGSSNQVNAGAGFTSDIKLSKNIKLSTGVALAQNTLKYNSSTPINTNAASALAYAATRQNDMLVPASSLPTFKNYNASLVGLDVPINIKYEFNPQKTDAYISAGLSSGTFINEAYTTSYGITHNSLLAGVTQQTTDQTDRQSFNSFYFAKTLNVSFGLGTALGKSNRLIIEPFLKYPLQGLGSQQIKFGAGGINLKLNFTNKK